MENENRPASTDEQLRNENEFLKMKLMLENGAVFGKPDNAEAIPPEIEHQFLNNIIEFEKKIANPVQRKIYEKLGRPTHFRPVAAICEEEFDHEWKQLDRFMREHGIELSACSPKVTSKELYRFTIEELFETDIDDVDIPGLVHGLIYDQFYPDLEYDNSLVAIDQCMREILSGDELQWDFCFFREGLRLKDKSGLSVVQLKELVNQAPIKRSTWKLIHVDSDSSIVQGNICRVTGVFSAIDQAVSPEECIRGTWTVIMEPDTATEAWYVREVDIEGIDIFSDIQSGSSIT